MNLIFPYHISFCILSHISTLQLETIIMGICNSKSPDNQLSYSTKAVLETDSFDDLNFYVTTQNMLRVDADCLILFCDEKLNLAKNLFLRKVSKAEIKKIKQYAQSHLLSSKARVLPGQIIFYPITIASLRFRFITLVCLKVWDGHQKIKINIENTLNNLFQQLNRHEIKSIAVTQFNQQFGIPTHLGFKLIAQAIFSVKDWLKIATFICGDSTSQSYFMQKLVHFKGNATLSNTQKTQKSNYY